MEFLDSYLFMHIIQALSSDNIHSFVSIERVFLVRCMLDVRHVYEKSWGNRGSRFVLDGIAYYSTRKSKDWQGVAMFSHKWWR